jgi:hypothetical protein
MIVRYETIAAGHPIGGAAIVLARELRYRSQGRAGSTFAVQELQGMDTKHARVIAAFAATALLLACSQNTGSFRAQRDMTKAQAESEKRVAGAQAYLDLMNSQYSSDIVNARVLARAHDPRNASKASTNNAEARRLRAEAKRKIADAQYGVDNAKAEAHYSVAKAQCGAHAGAASNACTHDATANYDSELSSAKSRKDTVLLAGTNNP